MTKIINYFKHIFGIKKSKSILDISSRDRKKIIREAIIESNKMQKEILKKYEKEFPHSRQKFYAQ